jgi:NAD(P)-dependent dehydrogenase (short-subunit alcohol dehydrogenase family)
VDGKVAFITGLHEARGASTPSASPKRALGKHSIRVNTAHPTGVPTPMAEVAGEMQRLLEVNPELAPLFMNTRPIPHTEAPEVANAVLFLASDESRHVTGLEFKVDAGANAR